VLIFCFNAFWLAVFYYADSLFVMGISFLIFAFLIYAYFFRNATKA